MGKKSKKPAAAAPDLPALDHFYELVLRHEATRQAWLEGTEPGSPADPPLKETLSRERAEHIRKRGKASKATKRKP